MRHLLTIVHNTSLKSILVKDPFRPQCQKNHPPLPNPPLIQFLLEVTSGLDKYTAVAVSTAVVLKHSDRQVTNEEKPSLPFPALFLRQSLDPLVNIRVNPVVFLRQSSPLPFFDVKVNPKIMLINFSDFRRVRRGSRFGSGNLDGRS